MYLLRRSTKLAPHATKQLKPNARIVRTTTIWAPGARRMIELAVRKMIGPKRSGYSSG
jgi:hypothetical protein